MIDWTRVNELRDEIGHEDFNEVVEMFLEEVEGIIERIQFSDTSSYEADFHALKGCALNLGFESFAQVCQNGEKLAAKGQESSIDLPSVFACFSSSKTDFFEGLDTS
ncbi:Hpt domain-containing protein [Sulfitobacter sp. BDSS02]|nr:Hpt domain-containing protein [Sulfitobacter sp. BDSS02]MBR9848714.1 Hpt domain-containing protein [Paracoccaceae bacterium]